MSAIANIIYGFISGVAEFLPVSSKGHQSLLRYFWGVETRIPLMEFLVHIGVMASVFVAFSEIIGRLWHEQKLHTSLYSHKRSLTKSKIYFDLRLLKTAMIPLFLGSFLYFITARFENNILLVMAFWIVNAVVLLIADHMPRGNRNARTMTFLDGIIIGIIGTLAVLPGISRTGMISSYTISRGVDNENTINWSVLLAIPALLFSLIFDFIGFFQYGFGVSSFTGAFYCLLAGVAAFGGGYLGISVFKLILNYSGLSKFAYYTLGASIFVFLTYLIT